MGLFGRKLGSRTLRLGERGPDVRSLHEFLRLQGYDLGEERYYGYLTMDAVRQFQREHGLVADGIAGKRFFALILREKLPIRRRIHLVEPKENLETITTLYGIGPQAFGLRNQGRVLYPGQTLVFFDREVWGIHAQSSKLTIPDVGLTGLVCSERPNTNELPWLAYPPLGKDLDLASLHGLLSSLKKRNETIQGYLQVAKGSQGLYLPWQEVALFDGARYLRFIRKLKRQLPASQMLWVELGPKIPPFKLWGGIDYKQVNELVDRVVLSLEPPLTRQAVEHLMEGLLPQIYSWKILLKVPVYAEERELRDDGVTVVKLSYGAALSRAHRHGARMERDEGGNPYYRYQRKGIHYQIHLPPLAVLGEIAFLANRHNLAGVIVSELGMEDPRLWSTLTSHFRPASFIFSEE